jgi:hypothetical protein
LSKSTRSSAPPTTSRRCFILPAKPHWAEIRCRLSCCTESVRLCCTPAHSFLTSCYTLCLPLFFTAAYWRACQTCIGIYLKRFTYVVPELVMRCNKIYIKKRVCHLGPYILKMHIWLLKLRLKCHLGLCALKM